MRTDTPDLSNVIPFPHIPSHAREHGFIRLVWWIPADWKDTLEDAMQRAIDEMEDM